MTLMLNAVLNEIAGTEGLEATEAANHLTGSVGVALVGALNDAAGTDGLGFNEVCNVLAGTSGLEAVAALNVWLSLGGGYDGGDPLSVFLSVLDGGTPEGTGDGSYDAGAA